MILLNTSAEYLLINNKFSFLLDSSDLKINSLGFSKQPKDTKVIIAMSGGVDSSTVAGLMKKEGYNVTGITLKLYDDAKFSKVLGNFPVAIEVIELARSAISRQIMKLGGKPVYRENFLTDNGNQIIDVHNMDLKIPLEVEEYINSIPGVVENGIFSRKKADIILKSSESGVENINLVDL